MTTLDDALHNATRRFVEVGIETAVLDAQVLLSYVTNRPKIELIIHNTDELTADEKAAYEKLVARREQHEPVAHITGTKEFWGLTFEVTPHTLIPRPDSETLVAAMVSLIKDKNAQFTFADMGTGSGCLLLSVLSEFQNAHGVGIDISSKALQVAKRNAESMGLMERCEFAEGEWADPLATPVDVIITNPPYVKSTDIATLAPDVKDFEPWGALDGGADGLDCYRALIPQAATRLNAGGLLMMEIGAEQAADVTALLEKNTWQEHTTFKDLSGHTRVVAAVRG